VLIPIRVLVAGCYKGSMNALKIALGAVLDHTRNIGMWILNNCLNSTTRKDGRSTKNLFHRETWLGCGHSNGLA
jgi:hypothetical protein